MEQPGHAIPKSTIVGTYVGLLILTALMLAISQVPVDRINIDWLDLHAIRTTVIMLTALAMGSIIALFLMGLRYDYKLLNVTIFLSNFVFLLIFVLFTWADTSFRTVENPVFTPEAGFKSPVTSEAPASEKPASEAPAAEAPASVSPASGSPASEGQAPAH